MNKSVLVFTVLLMSINIALSKRAMFDNNELNSVKEFCVDD